jgi:2-polyprenyl-3-methyl-5-hydroxy-6-metoxy-1,4-benzoquinol methylase
MLVFLLKYSQTKVFELDFGFKFCQKWTEEFWQCEIKFISEESRIGELGEKEDVLFFILDPLCVPSPRAKFLLKAALEAGYDLAAAVSNESVYDLQRAKVPYIYHNLSTFCEVADIMSSEAEIIPTDKIDPFLFAVKSKALKEDTKIKDIPKLPLKKGIVKAAFVHRFKDVFSAPREDLIALVPEKVKKILDIGCAEGGFGKTLKKIRQDIEITGIELSPSLAKKAKAVYDKVIIGDVEKIDIHEEEFDLINCGDIIEHLYNPWQLLSKINRWLKKGGYLIGSVPNVGHWSVVKDLLEGRFDYIPIGLLCIGHIRFFTENTLIEMLKDAGFTIEVWLKQKIPPPPQGEKFLKKIGENQLGNLDSLSTFSFQFRAKKVETG